MYVEFFHVVPSLVLLKLESMVERSESPGDGLFGVYLLRYFHFSSKHYWVVES